LFVVSSLKAALITMRFFTIPESVPLRCRRL